MSFVHKSVNIPELETKTVDRKRFYLTPEGKMYPSITTVLQRRKMQGLMEWRKRVGETKANEIATEAASIGTRMHKFLEDYVETGNWPSAGSNPYSQQANKMATTIKDKALSKIDEIWGSEVQLYHPKIYAAESIMDFKQTNKPKKEEWVEDYKLQLTAYALAHNEIYGTNIQEGHVFMCSRNNEYQQFDIYPDEFKSWESKWWDRVYLYYDQFA